MPMAAAYRIEMQQNVLSYMDDYKFIPKLDDKNHLIYKFIPGKNHTIMDVINLVQITQKLTRTIQFINLFG